MLTAAQIANILADNDSYPRLHDLSNLERYLTTCGLNQIQLLTLEVALDALLSQAETPLTPNPTASLANAALLARHLTSLLDSSINRTDFIDGLRKVTDVEDPEFQLCNSLLKLRDMISVDDQGFRDTLLKSRGIGYDASVDEKVRLMSIELVEKLFLKYENLYGSNLINMIAERINAESSHPKSSFMQGDSDLIEELILIGMRSIINQRISSIFNSPSNATTVVDQFIENKIKLSKLSFDVLIKLINVPEIATHSPLTFDERNYLIDCELFAEPYPFYPSTQNILTTINRLSSVNDPLAVTRIRCHMALIHESLEEELCQMRQQALDIYRTMLTLREAVDCQIERGELSESDFIKRLLMAEGRSLIEVCHAVTPDGSRLREMSTEMNIPFDVNSPEFCILFLIRNIEQQQTESTELMESLRRKQYPLMPTTTNATLYNTESLINEYFTPEQQVLIGSQPIDLPTNSRRGP